MDALKAQFAGEIVTKDDSEYPAAITRWAKNSERPAAMVVYPRSHEDIAAALQYARETKTPLAVKGGGHSAQGASSITDGLVIDLARHFAGVRVDASAKVAYVGGGAIWKTVDEEAIKYGLATVGGTVNHTGVGGLVLGGGYGWLCGQYGLAIDNVVEATIVTALGEVLKASDSCNPDLFFGIRGGGGNFGIATEFVLRLHPQPREVFAGMLVFPGLPGIQESLVKALLTWRATQGDHESMFFGLIRSPDGKPAFTLISFFNGNEADGKPRLQPFIDLKPVVNTVKTIPFEELNSLANEMARPGQNYYMTGTMAPMPEFLSSPRFSSLRSAQLEHSEGSFARVTVLLEMHPLRGIAKGTPAAFQRHPSNAIIMVMISWSPEAEGSEQQAAAIGRKIVASVEQDGGYANYDGEPMSTLMDPSREFDKGRLMFGPAYPRLQKTKGKYDPANVFNRWFPIQPEI